MKIDMNKKYHTKSGHKVRILCVDSRGSFPVIALIEYHNYDGVAFYTLEGNRYSGRFCGEDLVEVSPYEDFKIDDKVLVWNSYDKYSETRGHFAGVSPDGNPMIWLDGATSFTAYCQTVIYHHCEKYEHSDI